MAYGVKFRLDFADVKGTAKRVEILQDGYTGDVKELVGTGEPVVIKWEGDDDFYQPIIGSTCTLNLFQTDTTDYDDFFNAPEKEYKVIISTGLTLFDDYKERVQQDGGFVEAKSCIDNTFTPTISTSIALEYQKRVLSDGGAVEALDCISNILTVETSYTYATYWVGWLITDQYSEVMAPNPQRLTLKAIDGLGSLDSYVPTVDTDTTTIIERLAEGVNNIGLELDLYVNNDIKQVFTHGYFNDVYYPIEQYENFNGTGTYLPREGMKYEILDKENNLYNYKEFIEIILSNINARIFQSNGKWCIVNNSTYSEQRVMDDVQQILQDTSTLPTDVEQRRLNYLKTGTEFTNFRKYLDTSQATVATEYNYQALSKVKTDVTPLDQSLVREKERPYKKITLDVKDTSRTARFNHSLEYGDEFFTVNNGDIDTHDIVKSGTKSYELTLNSSSTTQPTTVRFATDKKGFYDLYENRVNFGDDANPNISFSFYVDTNKTTQSSSLDAYIWYRISLRRTDANKYYYDDQDQTWTFNDDTVLNKFNLDPSQSDQWIDKSITLDLSDPNLNLSTTVLGTLQIEFFTPYKGGISNYQALYLDNISIYQKTTLKADAFNNIFPGSGVASGVSDNSISIQSVSAEFNTTSSVIEKTFELPKMLKNYTHYIDSFGKMNQGIAAQPYFVEEQEYNYYYLAPKLYEAVLKQRINDFKTPMTRYEGTFYNNNTEPLSLMSKIWIDYGENILRENNSGIIDGLEYNVKSNEYNVIMHLPNQDNQLDVTIKKETTLVKKS